MANFIPQEAALALLEDDEWETDFQIAERVHKDAEVYFDCLPDWKSAGRRQQLRAGPLPGSNRPYEDFLNVFRDATDELLSSEYETRRIQVDYASDRAALIINAHAVYKVGPTLDAVVNHALVMVSALGMASSIWSVEAATAGYQLKEILKKIVSGYVRIEDANARTVFEAICQLRSKVAVTDFDALEERDFDKAYGLIGPTSEDVAALLHDKLSSGEVQQALDKLEDLGVISLVSGGWKIVF